MNDTKVISARVPMSSYLELIRRAKETKLSISDYVISALFEDIETQIKREEMIETLANNAETHRADAAKANLLLRHQIAKSTQLEERVQSLEETKKEMIHKHNFFVDNIITFMKDLDKSSLMYSYKKAIDDLPKEKWLESDA